jgi:hypothetical protein
MDDDTTGSRVLLKAHDSSLDLREKSLAHMRLFDAQSILFLDSKLQLEVDRPFPLPLQHLQIVIVLIVSHRIKFYHGVLLGMVNRPQGTSFRAEHFNEIIIVPLNFAILILYKGLNLKLKKM